MSKRHYPWWGYIKAIIREYPAQVGADLSGVAERNRCAVEAAIRTTECMEGGRNRLKVIHLLYWCKPQTLTLEGAALMVPCSERTAARWQRRFFEEVARNRDLLD